MPTPGTLLSALRVAVGAGAWATPNLAGKAFGLDPDANPQAAYLARLFGVRDVALATFAQATTGDARKLAWQLGIACDALDGVAAILGGRNGTLSTRTAVLAGGTGFIAAGLGVAALVGGE
ncbi:MAG: hypothetical protein AAGC46_03580 [Solirubrobacteraceae bacterium]|nr:hypothetical protein [Patulibacter sp.]